MTDFTDEEIEAAMKDINVDDEIEQIKADIADNKYKKEIKARTNQLLKEEEYITHKSLLEKLEAQHKSIAESLGQVEIDPLKKLINNLDEEKRKEFDDLVAYYDGK